MERQKGRRVFFAFIGGDEKSCSVIRRLGRTGITNTDMRRDRFPNAFERDGGRHSEISSEKIISTRRENNSAARFADGIQRFLKRGGGIGFSIRGRAEIQDGNGVHICLRDCGVDEHTESQSHQRFFYEHENQTIRERIIQKIIFENT